MSDANAKPDDQALHAQCDELLGLIRGHKENEETWGRELATPQWAAVLEAMTPRQKWLAGELWSQTRTAWSALDAHVAAGRLMEAKECRRDYAATFEKWPLLHNELFTVSQRGGSTVSVGDDIVPPGWTERRAFRDEQGRLASIFERPSSAR
jgi:hypothetical protein